MAKSSRTKPLRQRPAFKKLRELLKQTGQRDLLWHYRAGACVERLFPREGGRQYGQGRMTEITTALGPSNCRSNASWPMLAIEMDSALLVVAPAAVLIAA
jgi:hypothetical protein